MYTNGTNIQDTHLFELCLQILTNTYTTHIRIKHKPTFQISRDQLSTTHTYTHPFRCYTIYWLRREYLCWNHIFFVFFLLFELYLLFIHVFPMLHSHLSYNSSFCYSENCMWYLNDLLVLLVWRFLYSFTVSVNEPFLIHAKCFLEYVLIILNSPEIIKSKWKKKM